MTFTGNATNNNNRMDPAAYIAPLGNVTLQYDSAGNLQFDGVHQYFYDAENRLIQVDGTLPYCTSNAHSGSAATACYYYDADGKRVHRTGYTNDTCDNVGKRDYVFDLQGRVIVENNVNGTACDIQVYAGERHFGRQGGGSYFYHSDWLGTVRLVNSDQYPYVNQYNGDTCTSLPFGDGLTCNSNASNVWHFTGKERDYESNLDFFGARFDSSSLGRFTSPDQLGPGQHPEDPQGWNLYSYVQNNPLNLVDPTGQFTCDNAMTASQCNNVQAALDRAQDAADAIGEKYGWDSQKYLDAQRAIDAYGDEDVDNGVHVSIDKNQTDVGIVSIGDNVAKTDLNRSGQNISVSFKNGVLDNSNAKVLALEVAHEGVHVADASAWQHTGFLPSAQPRSYTTEFNAFRVMASLAEGFGSNFLLYPDKRGGSPFILYANIQSWSQAHTDFAAQGVVKSWYNLTPNSNVRAFQHNTSPQK